MRIQTVYDVMNISQVDLTRAMPLQLAPVENLSYAQLQQAAMLMQQQLILQNQLLHGQIAQQVRNFTSDLQE